MYLVDSHIAAVMLHFLSQDTADFHTDVELTDVDLQLQFILYNTRLFLTLFSITYSLLDSACCKHMITAA